jgi:hypothetical protein
MAFFPRPHGSTMAKGSYCTSSFDPKKFACPADYTVQKLDDIISYAIKDILLFIGLTIIITVIMVYVIMQITKVWMVHNSQKKRFDENKKKALQSSGEKSSKPSSNQLIDSSNDDEVYEGDRPKPSEFAESTDDYNNFRKSIQSSIDTYKTYNQKVSDFYKDVKKTDEAPDTIDRKILNNENDNY